MNLQTIKLNGHEFVLIPFTCYKANKHLIDDLVQSPNQDDEYVPFVPEDYFKNPVALERIKRKVTQKQLSKLLGCSQSYISQLESKDEVPKAVMTKVKIVLKKYPNRWANR